nr:hypothetical protein [uncultured bacterium]
MTRTIECLLILQFFGTTIATELECSTAVASEVLSGMAAGKPVEITADTDRFAGAISSIVWNGKEFIDSHDHGRELQSASNHGILGTPYCNEGYNPTEAGSRENGVGSTSSSVLNSSSVVGNTLSTESQLAFWLRPGQSNPEPCIAYSTGVLSEITLSKEVALGVFGVSNLIRHDVTFKMPGSIDYTYHQFEALTGYMPAEFSVFRTWNPKTGGLRPLSDGPGEQPLPVIFSTPDDQFAMGIFSFNLPQDAYPSAGFGRFDFPTANASGPGSGVVKWNAVYRYGTPNSTTIIQETSYSFRQYVAFGTLQDVTEAFSAIPEPSSGCFLIVGGLIVTLSKPVSIDGPQFR